MTTTLLHATHTPGGHCRWHARHAPPFYRTATYTHHLLPVTTPPAPPLCRCIHAMPSNTTSFSRDWTAASAGRIYRLFAITSFGEHHISTRGCRDTYYHPPPGCRAYIRNTHTLRAHRHSTYSGHNGGFLPTPALFFWQQRFHLAIRAADCLSALRYGVIIFSHLPAASRQHGVAGTLPYHLRVADTGRLLLPYERGRQSGRHGAAANVGDAICLLPARHRHRPLMGPGETQHLLKRMDISIPFERATSPHAARKRVPWI